MSLLEVAFTTIIVLPLDPVALTKADHVYVPKWSHPGLLVSCWTMFSTVNLHLSVHVYPAQIGISRLGVLEQVLP